MKRTDSIHLANEAEIALIQHQSSLLLQSKKNGFSGELKSSGAMIENYIKGILQKNIPGGYRICSGYIATPQTYHHSENLIQHDIIIVDERIPSLYKFGISDIEVVAAEAVCGVIEVKRTLSTRSLLSAVEHLKITKKVFDEYDGGKKSKSRAIETNTLSYVLTGSTYTPFFAIIGLDADYEIFDKAYLEGKIQPEVFEFIDLIWSPLAPFYAIHVIKDNKTKEIWSAPNVSRVHNNHESFLSYGGFDGKESGDIYNLAIRHFRTWIAKIIGVPMTQLKNDQYFNFEKEQN
ncbi:DUF6602 domain-containing protein [uncultured Nitrosomonas sp.]|uniref:DUF6602 domain-containing protein n=1 Tax=uncultured Nitrosomonas sp. TaxID=156424 RepID=UPI0025E8415A|nr:DUF6602 domain-containing protein [uncultured Nitrosomonas sp.]